MADKKDRLSKVLNTLSKITLKIVIPGIGLKKKQEKALMMKYVDKASIYEIAEELGMTYESTSNFLCKSRKAMFDILKNQKDVIPEDIKSRLSIFNESESEL